MALPKEIQTARLFLASEHGYLASVLWSLRPVEKPGIGTMGVDEHWRLYYDPALPSVWSEKEIVGVLYHEVNHLLRNHTNNGRARFFMHCTPPNPRCDGCAQACGKWNQAADAEINPGILKIGFELPKNVDYVMPAKAGLPDGLLAEEYFDKWPSQKGKGKGKSPGKGQGQEPAVCGGCAGNPADYEDGEPAAGDRLTQTEKELICRDVAKKIEEHAKNRGNIPADLQRWADTLLHPKVNWRKELRASARRQLNEVAGKREYSFKRPNRRQAMSQVILPTLRDFNPRLGIIRDTSGSMGNEDLAKTLAETRGILNMMGGEVIDIEVDCQVHAVKKVKSLRDVKMQGGGGTDMGIGIEHAATLRPGLDLVIVMTDGETPWPSVQPPFKTIVMLTRKGSEGQVPSWAKVILVED